MDKLLTNPNGKLLGNEDGKVYTTPAITDRTYKQKYQEVLWLGSDEIPLLPTDLTSLPSTSVSSLLTNMKAIWSDIHADIVELYGYDRVVFLANVDSIKKIVKCEIYFEESTSLYKLRVHSSVYKENVKECISINTYKRYMLVKDTYTYSSDSGFLKSIGAKYVDTNDIYYDEDYGGYSLGGKILKPNTNYLLYLYYSGVVLLLHTYTNDGVIWGQTSFYRDIDSDEFCFVSTDTEAFDDVDLLIVSSINNEIKNEEIGIYEMPF